MLTSESDPPELVVVGAAVGASVGALVGASVGAFVGLPLPPFPRWAETVASIRKRQRNVFMAFFRMLTILQVVAT